MSDGMSDGYRAAREADARQKTIDYFFGMVLSRVTGIKLDMKDFRGAFEAFDAHRHADNIARHRLEKRRGKRWEELLGQLTLATSETGREALHAWAKIFSLAMRFASPTCVEQLQAATPFKGHKVGLFVPNGTGFYGRIAPSLYGDFAGALDAMAEGTTLHVCAFTIEDPDRAITGLSESEGDRHGEIREEERGKLRFLAVKAR